jgi:hypothetical protein
MYRGCVQAVSTDRIFMLLIKASGGCPVPESHAHLGFFLIQQRGSKAGYSINLLALDR